MGVSAGSLAMKSSTAMGLPLPTATPTSKPEAKSQLTTRIFSSSAAQSFTTERRRSSSRVVTYSTAQRARMDRLNSSRKFIFFLLSGKGV